LQIITRTQARTHKSGVLPYPLQVFFAGAHRTCVQLPSLRVRDQHAVNHCQKAKGKKNTLKTHPQPERDKDRENIKKMLNKYIKFKSV